MIKKTYYWKEISENGLLKEPKEFGGHYATESINGWEGFDSEDKAIEKLIQIHEAYEHEIPSDLILVKLYRVVDDKDKS